MNNELWYFLIDGQEDNETGIVGNFYAYGHHFGDALQKVIQASLNYSFNNPNLTEASLLEKFDDIDKNDELVEIAELVYMRPTTYTFPFDDPDKEFVPPIGIVKSVDEGEYDYEVIKENFVAYWQNGNGIFELELVVAKPNLINLFLKSISFMPTVDGIWIYIQPFWENDSTELWVAKHFTTSDVVTNFLKAYQKDTLENGYLKIVTHSLTGETNLTLDDHKKIQLHTKDEEVFRHFIGRFIDMGYEQTRDFYSLEFGFHHWHYRPAGSLTRSNFKSLLEQNKFELLDA